MRVYKNIVMTIALLFLLGGSCEFTAEASTKQNSNIVSIVTLSKKNIELEMFKTLTLKVSITPSNVLNKSIIWSSSDKHIATVSSKGIVTANNVGVTKITAKTKNGKKAVFYITVTEPNIQVKIKTSVRDKENSFYNYNYKYIPDLYKNEKLFRWFAKEDKLSDSSVYRKAISIIFPNGTEKIDDWIIVRNVCYWALNDYMQGPHESIFKIEYENVPKDWEDKLKYMSGTYQVMYVVQHILGFLDIECYKCDLSYICPLIAINLDGDWYYAVLRASNNDINNITYEPILVSGEYIKEGFDKNFVDVFNANHHEYHDGTKVWYIESLDYLLTDEGIKEFCRRMEESKFTIRDKTYIGIGIGIRKKDCSGDDNNFILTNNPNRTADEYMSLLDSTYAEMYYFGNEDVMCATAFQLVRACAIKLGYTIIDSCQINYADETNINGDYAFATGFFLIK